MAENRNAKGLKVVAGALLVIAIGLGAYVYLTKNSETPGTPGAIETPAATTPADGAPPAETAPTADTPAAPQTDAGAPAANGKVDLGTDANGLSHSTVVIKTAQGDIKFKFYSKDAPNTVNRIVELIQKGFYNGLTFHRVVPNFVIQGGDPAGNGTGGSGQKLKAEFNSRKHVEGAVAMARASDPDSADSQFYIALGTIPHLDGQYTVFGQVVEGLDIVKRIAIGDKMNSVTIQ